MENLTRTARKSFGRLGWSLIAHTIVGLLFMASAQVLLILDYVMTASGGQGFLDFLHQHSLTYVVLFILPIYFICTPLAVAILWKLPGTSIQKNHLSVKQLIGFGLVTLALETLVSLLVTIFTEFIYRDIQLPIQEQALGVSFLVALNSFVLAPVFEELLFRKILLDRFRRYGEGLAILVSAVTFGLLHMNLQQSAVACVLGAVLAYIYLRSGNIWYCILLHSASNFLANGMMSVLLSRLSPKAWLLLQTQDQDFLTPEIVSELYPLVGYMLFFCCLTLAGLFLLVRHRKAFHLLPAEDELEPRQAAGAVFGSAGMILYLVITLSAIAIQFVLPLFTPPA